jgi:hypothetical protein
VVVNPLFLKHNHFPKCHVREDAVLEDLNLFGWATFTLGNLTLTVWYWKWSHLVWWFTYQQTSKNYITNDYVIHIPFISSSMAKSPCLILNLQKNSKYYIPWYSHHIPMVHHFMTPTLFKIVMGHELDIIFYCENSSWYPLVN